VQREKTLLALGAHCDDCMFGLGGTLLQAVRRGYRVVILNLIGQYRGRFESAENTAWLEKATAINRQFGVETRFLALASGRFDVDQTSKRAVAEVVAEVRPDTAFTLWPQDHHADHVATAAIAHAALQLGGRILGRTDTKSVWRIHAYDNGPRHTIGFSPNTFVDISQDWTETSRWIGEIGALYRDATYDPATPEPNQRSKEILAAYRGLSAGVAYAEAFWSAATSPAQILD